MGHPQQEYQNVLNPSRVVVVAARYVVSITLLVPLIHGLRSDFCAFEFCARIFKFYIGDFFNALDIVII
jgi:hypothetical protein